MRKKRKLIVNADDFGLHESINTAIEAAYKEGILTSTSLVVNGDAFDHAIEIVKRNKNLGVGLHLTLCGEKPITPPIKIQSLVDTKGRLYENHKQLCLKILKKKVRIQDLNIEIEAQIDKFMGTGLIPTHIDSHRHLHFFPPIFNTLKPLLRKKNLDTMRYLNIPFFEFRRGDFFKRAMAFFFKYFGLINGTQFRHQDYFLGFFDSGHLNRGYFESLLHNLRPGTTEINLHPGKNNSEIRKKYNIWDKQALRKFNWEREFSILMDDDLKSLIKKRELALIKYSDL